MFISNKGRCMLNIRYRNIVRNEDQIIVSGSATLVENQYSPHPSGDRTKNHTKQVVVERLGKVLWINENNKHEAIFNSPTRGLVFYSLDQDQFTEVSPNDPRLKGTIHTKVIERVYTNIGTMYLFFSLMKKYGSISVLRSTFKDSTLYQRVLAHIFYDCFKNDTAISCSEFISKSVLSYILSDVPINTLDCDHAYFSALADEKLKLNFFKAIIEQQRKINPNFGRCCYTDLTSLPQEELDNPFNALFSQDAKGDQIQFRLVLLLDLKTHIPVWFEVIPTNFLALNSITSITKEVKQSLDLDVDHLALASRYASVELFQKYNITNNTYIDDQGVHHEHTVLIGMSEIFLDLKADLYRKSKPYFYNPNYSFDYAQHTYFGERFEVSVFGSPMYAFVFVDQTQAESLLREWRSIHGKEWADLSMSEKEWYQVKNGFFILLGNKDQSPKEALIQYRILLAIENYSCDAKAYLKIMPTSKWNKQTVLGKIFHDLIETIIYQEFRKQAERTNLSMSSVIERLDSWECFRSTENRLETNTPNWQVREILEKLDLAATAHFDLNALRAEILKGEK